MNHTSMIAIFLATCLLLLGILLGFSNFTINLRVMHSLLSLSFILLVILGLRIHYSRLIYKSPTNFIAWLHFVIFSFLLFISIRALRKWYFTQKHNNHNH